MSKVLGSFSADQATLYIANRNIKPDELSLVFQEGGLSICFFMYVNKQNSENCGSPPPSQIHPRKRAQP